IRPGGRAAVVRSGIVRAAVPVAGHAAAVGVGALGPAVAAGVAIGTGPGRRAGVEGGQNQWGNQGGNNVLHDGVLHFAAEAERAAGLVPLAGGCGAAKAMRGALAALSEAKVSAASTGSSFQFD